MKQPESPDVEKQIDKVFSDQDKQELEMHKVEEEGDNQLTNGQVNNTEQIEMEYNKIQTDQNKDLRVSQGKDSIKSRTNQKQGALTMEPEDSKPADFDVSASKKVDTLDSQGVMKQKINSKSSLGENGEKSNVTYAEGNQEEQEKFNQTQGLLLMQSYGQGYDSDGNAEIKTNTKLIKCIDWCMKNPLKIIIGFLVFLMFFISIFVGIRNGDLGVFDDQMDIILDEQEKINATHKVMDDKYWGLMNSTYSPIYENAQSILGQLYNQNGAIDQMMAVFKTKPEFVKTYGNDDGFSVRLANVYDNIQKTGGPFFEPLDYENAKGVKVPNVLQSMQKDEIDVLGFFQLKRLQLDENRYTTFIDVDILLIQPEFWTQQQQIDAVRILLEYQEDPKTTKCCLEYSGSDPNKRKIDDLLYGYVRLIQYQAEGQEYADFIFEGQLAGGYNKWTGYGRWMQLAVAVGWWSEKDKLKGQGITHNGDHFEYEGTWNGTNFFNQPAVSHKVTDLSKVYEEKVLKQMQDALKEAAEEATVSENNP